MMFRRATRLLLLAALCALTGCAGGNKPAPEQVEGSMAGLNAWLHAQQADLPAAPYLVQSPDVIQIHCPTIKELDKQKFVVRPDGKIYAPLIGEVQVANLTPAQISEVMAGKLQAFYKTQKLDISIAVTDFKSKVIFVMGQVVKPGLKPYTGRDTVLAVLADAKLNELAWPQRVVIVRRTEDPNDKKRVTIDVKEMFEHGKLTQNYLLEEGDVVYVPPSPLAETAIEFGKILYPIVPVTNMALLATGHGI